MEKSDSLATVTVKEFPDNESYTTEPPPFQAYRQHKSTAVQVAKIVAVTVVAASAILGACILASAWIQARATCELMMMEHQLQQAEMRAEQDRPSFEALVQENAGDDSSSTTTPETTSPEPAQQEQENQENDVQKIKLPLQLDFDDLAGSLMERNQRAHMNCVVEKRRSEELVDHAPRALRLPFGLNLTTPPRLEHLTGERMVIKCESGNDQNRQMPMPHAPMMIPLPGPVHMPMNFPMPPQHPPQPDSPHHPEMAAMIFEHHAAPVPLSAMVPPPAPQHHEQHEQHQPEGRAFHGFPIPIQIRELVHHAAENEDQQRDETNGDEARLFPGIHLPVQIRQINVHEQAPQQLRPHYVQPRSVPSNPDFLGKRVKRCACNCDC